MTRKSNAVTKARTDSALTVVKPDYIKNGSRGSEDVSASDVAMPRLEIVQSLSPQRKKSDVAYIDGAEEGDVFHTVLGILCDRPVPLIPVLFQKQFLLWRMRDVGGGFGGAFDSPDSAERERLAKDDPEEWEVLDTHQHFCLWVKPDGNLEPVVLSMSKSKLTASRQWNALIRAAGGDRFSRVYHVDTVLKENQKGDYYAWRVAPPAGFPSREHYEEAERLYEAMATTRHSVAYGPHDEA